MFLVDVEWVKFDVDVCIFVYDIVIFGKVVQCLYQIDECICIVLVCIEVDNCKDFLYFGELVEVCIVVGSVVKVFVVLVDVIVLLQNQLIVFFVKGNGVFELVLVMVGDMCDGWIVIM